MPDPLRDQLNATHREMLAIHKTLIDRERDHYVHAHGPIASPGQFLNLLINDPFFAWLRPMSMLIAQIDEFVSSKKSPDPAEGRALLARARHMLSPSETGDDFQRRFQQFIHESPEVALAHGQWKRVAKNFPPVT